MKHSTPTPYFPDNLENYAAWVAKYGLLAPYGICQCGCGQPTEINIGQRGTTEKYARGDFFRFRSAHSLQAPWYESIEDYFWTYCTIGAFTECWEWQGSICSTGYGIIFFRGKEYKAHRVSWEIHNGEQFPKGKMGCHECDNPPCVNPYHIWPGTRSDNTMDMVNKRRHAFGERNWKAKLTDEQVEEIRQMHQAGHTPTELGQLYNVTDGTIGGIVAYRAWKHVRESTVTYTC